MPIFFFVQVTLEYFIHGFFWFKHLRLFANSFHRLLLWTEFPLLLPVTLYSFLLLLLVPYLHTNFLINCLYLFKLLLQISFIPSSKLLFNLVSRICDLLANMYLADNYKSSTPLVFNFFNDFLPIASIACSGFGAFLIFLRYVQSLSFPSFPRYQHSPCVLVIFS